MTTVTRRRSWPNEVAAGCWDTSPELLEIDRGADQWQTPSPSPTTAPARPTRSTSPTRRSAASTSARSRSTEDDFGLMTYDPGVHEHGLLPVGDHLHRRRRRDPPAPRLPDRGALREVHLPRGRLPADLRRAARPARSSSAGSTTSPTTPSSTRTSRSSTRASATTPTRWACSSPPSARCPPSIPTRKKIDDEEERYMAAIRLIAKMPTLAAFSYRHSLGLPYVYPDNDLSYAGQLPLDDVEDDRGQVRARPAAREGARRPLHPPRRPRAELLDERRCASVGSSQVDPYSAVAAGVAALYGPLHGGANEAVLRMLAGSRRSTTSPTSSRASRTARRS